MNAIVAGHAGQSKAIAGCRHCLAVPMLLGLVAAAHADDAPIPTASVVPIAAASDAPIATAAAPSPSVTQPNRAQDERSRLQLELSGTHLPRFDNTDSSSHTSRLALTWLPPRRSALGLAVGMSSPSGSSLARGPAFAANSSSVDLGLHWRYMLDSNYRVDVTAWRRMAPIDEARLLQDQAPAYGARIEMGIGQATRKGFVADRGFLGFQLESGARITVRRSGGRPMVYYRTKF